MSRRQAVVRQADIARTIRAMRDAGLTVVRVVVRPDGVALETTEDPPSAESIAAEIDPADGRHRDIIL
ncbi:hypothetical protein [Methylobacterium nodulans]|uniref:Uncharacterized protein n=1 Tax=Methylobacterium nodulans (strain LMG 21967 / CNCM I-2342 / ORS 2060) TaxID=460265 RepID=B8IMX9_METNO|nr:hypothetical protein [Methylobacterium nodulans]ACL62095.1 conserved hypothetical protein [Methylobacterium nodulans ORS 2060]